MSLDYDLTKVEDRDTSDEGWARTTAVIFAAMETDIGTLTNENVTEAFARYELGRRATGDQAYLTLADFRAHIGLHTNVSTKTRTAYLNKIKSILSADLERGVRRAKAIVDLESEVNQNKREEN